MTDPLHVPPFGDIFAARPHIFAGTAMIRAHKACWIAWIFGPGYDLHAEYMFATATPYLSGECFCWDRVFIPKDLVKSTPDREVYTLETDEHGYGVTIYHRTIGGVHYDYKLAKYNELAGDAIIIFLSGEPYEHDAQRVFAACDIMPCLQVTRRQRGEDGSWNESSTVYFSWINDDLYTAQLIRGREPPLMPAHRDPTSWSLCISHNIESVIDFMRTSRLNLADHLPRVTIREEDAKNKAIGRDTQNCL
jgi:hypothetical protein